MTHGLGEPIEDPSAGQVDDAVQALAGGTDAFVILRRDPYNYMQTIGGPGEGFVLEAREGAPRNHVTCNETNLRRAQVREAFQDYLRGDDKWKQTRTWQLLFPELQEARIERDDGHLNLVVPIDAMGWSAGHFWCRIDGTLDGVTIGAVLSVRDSLVGDNASPLLRIERGLVVASTGAATTRLRLALAKMYELPPPAGAGRALTPFDLIPLDAVPGDLKQGASRALAIHDARPSGPYAEFELTLDVAAGIVSFGERDPGYRRTLVATLGPR